MSLVLPILWGVQGAFCGIGCEQVCRDGFIDNLIVFACLAPTPRGTHGIRSLQSLHTYDKLDLTFFVAALVRVDQLRLRANVTTKGYSITSM